MTKTSNYNLNKIETTDNIMENIQQLGENAEIIDEVLNEIEAIAKGRATGYVFDTLADLELWLQNIENTSKLVLGDNLYIRDTSVPDYWWDGTAKQELETQKVDLTEYKKVLVCTQDEYDALESYDDGVMYCIPEEA